MRTREELAETIAVTLRGEDQFGYTDISDLSDAVLDSRYDLLAVADAVLADYQPKPRTVDNIEELRELPVGTVIWYSLRYDGQAMYSVMEKGLDGTWLSAMDPEDDYAYKPAASRDGLVHPGGNSMSTYLEELATLAAKIGDDNAKATLDLGWIGPQERDALVDAAQQARKQLDKARTDLQQAQMTANMPNVGGAM